MVAMRSSTLSPDEDALTERIIGAAIVVHKQLGPGLLEGLYQKALTVRLEEVGLPFRREVPFLVHYAGKVVGEHRLDLLVDDKVVLELKAVEALNQLHKAQLLTYLRTSGVTIGLLINFGTELIQVKRVLNTHQYQNSSPRPSVFPS